MKRAGLNLQLRFQIGILLVLGIVVLMMVMLWNRQQTSQREVVGIARQSTHALLSEQMRAGGEAHVRQLADALANPLYYFDLDAIGILTRSALRAPDVDYVLVYDQAHAAAAQQILGDEADDARMWQRSLERAQAEAAANPTDAFAWFNLGNSLTAQGRYADAASAFDQARVIGLPWRMLWYQFEPFRAYYEAGRHDELLALADSVIATAGNIEETYYWRGRALQATGDSDAARAAYQRAVELNSNYVEPQQALAELGG